EVDHLRVEVAWPGPAAEVGDALIVDRDDGDLVVRNPGRRLHADVVRFAFEALDQIAAAHREHRHRDDDSQEPVALPETQLAHQKSSTAQSNRSGLYEST